MILLEELVVLQQAKKQNALHRHYIFYGLPLAPEDFFPIIIMSIFCSDIAQRCVLFEEFFKFSIKYMIYMSTKTKCIQLSLASYACPLRVFLIA